MRVASLPDAACPATCLTVTVHLTKSKAVWHWSHYVGVVKALTQFSYQTKRLLELAETWPSDATDGDSQLVAATPRRTARQLAPGELDEIVAAYRAGATVYQLAEQFKQHRTTIGQHLREAGVDTRPPAVVDKDIALLVELYEAGWALARIAKRYGVSPHAVHDRLIAAGVMLRTRGGSRPKMR